VARSEAATRTLRKTCRGRGRPSTTISRSVAPMTRHSLRTLGGLKSSFRPSLDPGYAKTRALSSPMRPAFLTGDVLANAFVDLDRVFDFHFATAESPRIRFSDIAVFGPDFTYLIYGDAMLGGLGGRPPPPEAVVNAPSRFAASSTSRPAGTVRLAVSDTLASNAGSEAIPSGTAMTGAAPTTGILLNVNNIPRFARGFLWDEGLSSRFVAPVASASEHADPLPSPPASILNHPDTCLYLISSQ
jgi:hypothetical protein